MRQVVPRAPPSDARSPAPPLRHDVSHQLESVHYLRSGDEVRHQDGRTGRVQDALTLYAVVRWDGGAQEEVDQLDPRVFVVERATSG